MQIGASTHPARRWSLLALVALLGLAVTFSATSASSASSGHAVAAKKKCKKKHKSAASAKKKKCKKKKKQQPVVTPPTTPTTPSTPSGPTVRASATWDTSDQVDLHVFDTSGHHAFYDDEFDIPDAVESDQDEPGGPETFVDQQSPSTRSFSFYVCLYSYFDDMQTTGAVHVTVDVTDPGGAHRSIPVVLEGEGDEVLVTNSPTSTDFPHQEDFCYDGDL